MKIVWIAGSVVGLVLVSLVPVVLLPSVVSGVTVPDSMVSVVMVSVDMHFDHPLQRIFIFRYQIVDRQVEPGSMDQYIVQGKTFFGVTAVRARVGADGIVTQ